MSRVVPNSQQNCIPRFVARTSHGLWNGISKDSMQIRK